MSVSIIDRGRGPELEGTRVTVYRVMDFVREGATPEMIASELDLSSAQVHAALEYVAVHRDEVDADYARILARGGQSNPDWVDAQKAASPEELKRRILARRAGPAHAGDRRQ